MKNHRLAVVITLGGLVALPSRASAIPEIPIDVADGGSLVIRTFGLFNGQIVTARTSNCGGSEDTVLYLLQNTGPGTFSTVLWDDDAGDGLCSYLSASNQTGFLATYTLILVSFGPVRPWKLRHC